MRNILITTLAAFVTLMSSANAEDITSHCTIGSIQQRATCAMQAELDRDNYDVQLAYDMMDIMSFNCDAHPFVSETGTEKGLSMLRTCINKKHAFMDDVRGVMEKYRYPTMDSARGSQMYPKDEIALQRFLQNRRRRMGFE